MIGLFNPIQKIIIYKSLHNRYNPLLEHLRIPIAQAHHKCYCQYDLKQRIFNCDSKTRLWQSAAQPQCKIYVVLVLFNSLGKEYGPRVTEALRDKKVFVLVRGM